MSILSAIASFLLRYWVEIIVSVVALIVLWRVGVTLGYLWFDSHMRRKMIFMKVTLARSDSKLDKERETKKDFREAVGIMQQLYRALYEIKELNLWNRIWSKIHRLDRVSFELFLENRQLYFYVATFPYYQSIVEKQVTTFYPDAEVEYVKAPKMYEPGYDVKGYYIKLLREFWLPVKTFKILEDDPLNDLANALDKVHNDERAAIQLVIRPIDDKWSKRAKEEGTAIFKGKKKGGSGIIGFIKAIPILGFIGNILDLVFRGDSTGFGKTNAPGAGGGDSYVRMLQTDEENAKRIGEKANQVGFATHMRVFVASKEGNARVEDLLNNLVVALNVFSEPSLNTLQNRRIFGMDLVNTPLLYSFFENRAPGIWTTPMILTPEELASIYHFPNSTYNRIPIIFWKSYKALPAPSELPKEGVVIGASVHRGTRRLVRIQPGDRMRHQYIIGKSGTGKSVLLSYMARQDIWNGDGVCVVDPHGDLIEDILNFVPKERARDVIVFDPSNRDRPMGLNILEAKTDEEKDRASLDATQIFIKLFGDEIFGPRIQHYFRNACLTLMDDEEEGATLIDVPRIFTDEEFMKYKVSKIKNSVVRSFWDHEYASTGEREKQEMIPYFSAKFGPFITNTTMRNVIGQAKSAFNIRECMDNRKVLLINLSKGKIGDLNAQLLGLVLVNKISMSAMSRVDMLEEERKEFYLYVDEFQNFATDTFATILSEARKYRLALIMAHQYINQLVVSKFGQTSTQIRDAVFGNVGTIMSFKVGAEDAEYLAKEYAPILSEQDIIGISNYKTYTKLNINNTTSRPFSMEMIYDNKGKNPKIADILKKYSSLKYGRKKIFVDQEIEARLGILNGAAATEAPIAAPTPEAPASTDATPSTTTVTA